MSDIPSVDNDNFANEIGDSSAAVLDFYATWCGPCKTIAPIVEDLAETYSQQGLKFGKVDIDQASELALKFQIEGVPTLIFFKDGEPVDKLVGAYPRQIIEDKVKGLL